MPSTVYLIPSLLDEEAIATILPYTIDAIKNCKVFFVENERTARRFIKKIWKEIKIDDYEWFVIDKGEPTQSVFSQKIQEEKNIGIISEAGCPGVADPGQELISVAQEMNITIKPLVGPNSVLLALMASGMNGQQFQFIGYLPIQEKERIQVIRELEAESRKRNCTQIFIETPYRNNQLVESILKTCKSTTKFCIATNLTGKNERIKTKTIKGWKNEKPDLHKQPTIFLLFAVE
ncbi:MAG TPA: SAM-dependent methyltransferase [Chitinophagaceae bacterium]